MSSSETYRICSRCVSDTTVPDIRFDEHGICNFCHTHDALNEQFPLDEKGRQKLDQIIKKIQKDGKGQKYDCIVGVSGGTDSTFCLYIAHKLGLRSLAVHFDNGWDSEESVSNIRNAVRKLGIDLKWIEVDFEEFSDIQRSFLRASVPDAEIPTDIAIHAVLHRTAAENNIKWIINGMNFRTEGIQPLKWSYMDGRYVRSVQERFGHRPLVTYPNLTIPDMINFSLLKGIKTVPLLAYMNYSKEETKDILKREVDWTDYGGHHFVVYIYTLRDHGYPLEQIPYRQEKGFVIRCSALGEVISGRGARDPEDPSKRKTLISQGLFLGRSGLRRKSLKRSSLSHPKPSSITPPVIPSSEH